MNASTPSSPAASRPAVSLKNILILAVPLALVVLLAAGYWVNFGRTPADADYAALMADYAKRFGPRLQLDASRYSDKNGDLVADAPAEKDKLVNPAKLVFTGLTQDDAEQTRAVWKDFLDYLSKQTGKPVEYDVTLTEPDAQVAALREGRLHVTGFSTGLVMTAVNTAGFVPAVVPADEKGHYGYQMEIIVPADSPIQSAADLKGRRLTFSTRASNAGTKAPVYLLRANFNLEPGKDYSFHFSGGYRESLQGIANKQFEAAAVANDYLEREVVRGTIRREQFRSVFKSETFPPLCFGYAHNLDPELAAKVRQAFVSFPWKGTSVEKEYGPAGLAMFKEVNYKTDWAFVRAADEGMLRLAQRSR